MTGVLRGCLAGYLSCTSLDAPTRRQTEVYFEAVRLLREWLVPLGWEFDNADQQPRVFHRSRGWRSSSPAATATPARRSRTRAARAKGEATLATIAVNQNQMAFDFAGAAQDDAALLCTTHVLLVNVDVHALSAELSVPAAMDASGHVDSWTSRILLPSVNREPEPILGAGQGDGPVFDVAVQRR